MLRPDLHEGSTNHIKHEGSTNHIKYNVLKPNTNQIGNFYFHIKPWFDIFNFHCTVSIIPGHVPIPGFITLLFLILGLFTL